MLWVGSPLDLKVLENKNNVKQSAKQNGLTNSLKPGVVQAIVILGGGRRRIAIEYPQYQDQNIEPSTMERVRYGVNFSEATLLRILLTGGAPDVI